MSDRPLADTSRADLLRMSALLNRATEAERTAASLLRQLAQQSSDAAEVLAALAEARAIAKRWHKLHRPPECFEPDPEAIEPLWEADAVTIEAW